MITLEAGKKYVARNGKQIEIFDTSEGQCHTFRARGHILRVDSLGRTYRKFNIWKLTGQFMAYGEHGLDIVAEASN